MHPHLVPAGPPARVDDERRVASRLIHTPGVVTGEVAPGRRYSRPVDELVDELEEGLSLRLDWDKLGKVGRADQQVLPVVLQDADSGDVLFVGYANEAALAATLERRSAVLWSTSRNELWHKGSTSGDTLELVEVRVNCEQNSLLYRVRPATGGACHTKGADGQARASCYYRRVTGPDALEPA